MCNCFTETLEKINEKIKPKNCEEFESDWKGKILRFDGGFGVGLYVDSEYYKIKKNGDRFQNKTKNSNFIAMSFCPFCGKKFNE